MIIGVAGPYSAETEIQRKNNLDAMNLAAAKLLEKGHTPLIGMNAALPVVDQSQISDRYQAIMDISLAVISACEAILVIGDSPGVRKEKELIESRGLKVYYSLEEVPDKE